MSNNDFLNFISAPIKNRVELGSGHEAEGEIGY